PTGKSHTSGTCRSCVAWPAPQSYLPTTPNHPALCVPFSADWFPAGFEAEAQMGTACCRMMDSQSKQSQSFLPRLHLGWKAGMDSFLAQSLPLLQRDCAGTLNRLWGSLVWKNCSIPSISISQSSQRENRRLTVMSEATCYHAATATGPVPKARAWSGLIR
ncbi:hypothetical protein JZ751_014131, partial [Albula glossodonta]